MRTFIRGLVLGAAVLALSASTAVAQGFKVIAHPSVGTSSISKEDLSRIFLKRVSTWPSGEAAQPVDQSEGSDIRQRFCSAVHGRDAQAIKAFWTQQIFAGRGTPPATKASDDAVLSYVSSTPGAVGYVSADANVGSQVKVLHVGS